MTISEPVNIPQLISVSKSLLKTDKILTPSPSPFSI